MNNSLEKNVTLIPIMDSYIHFLGYVQIIENFLFRFISQKIWSLKKLKQLEDNSFGQLIDAFEKNNFRESFADSELLKRIKILKNKRNYYVHSFFNATQDVHRGFEWRNSKRINDILNSINTDLNFAVSILKDMRYLKCSTNANRIIKLQPKYSVTLSNRQTPKKEKYTLTLFKLYACFEKLNTIESQIKNNEPFENTNSKQLTTALRTLKNARNYWIHYWLIDWGIRLKTYDFNIIFADNSFNDTLNKLSKGLTNSFKQIRLTSEHK